MVRIKQKAAAPEIDWTGIDAVIERESHPQLAKRLDARAGDNEGNLIAPGINRIYARIGDDAEATIVMYAASQNINTLQLDAPIKVYWNKEENSHVYDGLGIGTYNQASGGQAPQTLPTFASYWLAVANAALPNAYALDDATNGIVINDDGVPSGLAPGTARNVAIGASSTAWEARALVNADLPVVDASHGGTGNSTNTANNLLVGAGTSPVTFIAPSTAGRMLRSNGTTWNPYLNNIAATAAPTTGDDSNDGYAVGSYWLDLTNDHIYIAIDVSVGAAVWLQVDGGTVDWANPGTIGSSTPNTGAFTTLTATTGQFDPNSNNRTEILVGGVQQTRAESSNLTQPNYHLLRRAGGSIASPSATQNTQVIARWEADSHSGSAYVTAGYLQYEATETHSGSVRGTKATIRTTQAGGTTARDTVFKDYGALNPPALSADPSAPAEGDLWRNTARTRHRVQNFGLANDIMTSPYKQVGDVTVTGTVSGVAIISSAPTFPGGSLVTGTVFRIVADGYITTSGTATRTWLVDFNGVTVLNAAWTSMGTFTNVWWQFECRFGINAVGSSGNVWAQGHVKINLQVRGFATTAVSSAINFNNNQPLNVTFTPGSTSDALHCNLLTIEAI